MASAQKASSFLACFLYRWRVPACAISIARVLLSRTPGVSTEDLERALAAYLILDGVAATYVCAEFSSGRIFCQISLRYGVGTGLIRRDVFFFFFSRRYWAGVPRKKDQRGMGVEAGAMKWQ
jgi:hypothetical protein